MANDLERQLLTLKYGDHICLIYENTAERLSAVVPFIVGGLARGDRCISIGDDQTQEEVVQALAAAGVDVARECQRGALRLMTPLNTYLRAGEFVPQAMIDFIRQAETEALADGFSGLRLAAEPYWSFGPEPDCGRLIEYEALLNQLPTSSKSVILCQYHQSRFGAPCIHDVLRTHPVAIVGDQFCPNPYYELPKMVLSREQAETTPEFKAKRVDWWIAQLKRANMAEQEREHTLEKLKQSERRLAEAQQVAHIGSWERDLRTEEVTWSDELYRLFGLQAHEVNLSYQQFLNLVVPEDADRIRALVDEAIRERRRFNFDYRITLPDGSVRVLNDRGDIILNEEGEAIRLVGTIQEVTELRQAEQDLKRQKMILQTIFDHIPVMINFIDAAGRVQMINRHWERVLGWSLEEAQTRDLLSAAYPDPEDLSRAREYILHPPPGWTDFKMRVRNGRTLDILWALIVLPDGTRIGFGQDITQRKRAERELREHSESVQALSRRLLEVQEEERRHLARELHDELGQILSTLSVNLQIVLGGCDAAVRPRLEDSIGIIDQAIQQVRNLSLDLRPSMLDDLGLIATLRWSADRHAQRAGFVLHFAAAESTGRRLPAPIETAGYRVVQEAMTNVVRHARARQVWLSVEQGEDEVQLEIRDDGVGFDVANVRKRAAQGASFGILGMQERVELLGGTVEIQSRPGQGTKIRVHLPIESGHQPNDGSLR